MEGIVDFTFFCSRTESETGRFSLCHVPAIVWFDFFGRTLCMLAGDSATLFPDSYRCI